MPHPLLHSSFIFDTPTFCTTSSYATLFPLHNQSYAQPLLPLYTSDLMSHNTPVYSSYPTVQLYAVHIPQYSCMQFISHNTSVYSSYPTVQLYAVHIPQNICIQFISHSTAVYSSCPTIHLYTVHIPQYSCIQFISHSTSVYSSYHLCVLYMTCVNHEVLMSKCPLAIASYISGVPLLIGCSSKVSSLIGIFSIVGGHWPLVDSSN